MNLQITPGRPILMIAMMVATVQATFPASANVVESSPNGFLIQITRELDCDTDAAYEMFVANFSKWYDAEHSYSQKAENLSLDLEKCCMLERLPNGGFVRHMEIVFHRPGKLLRMTGGLGPLQGMGVSGAMSFTFVEANGKSRISMIYNVSGADHSQLDKIAGPVDRVLNGQLDRYQRYCNTGDPREKQEQQGLKDR